MIVILAGGLVLRLVAIGSRPLWYDEAFSILLARRSLDEIVAGTAADTMPPLYYFLLHGWMIFGQDVAALRSLNVMLAMALIYLAYLWARAIYGEASGLLAGLLAATSPFLIYHAQELRMYTLLALALSAYAYLFTRLEQNRDGEEPRRVHWWGLTLTAAVALYSHNLALFTLLAPDIYLTVRRRWRTLRRLLLAQGAALVLALPWLIVVPQQIAKIQRAFWTPRPGFLEALQAAISLHYNLPVPESWIAVAVAGSLLTLALTGHAIIRRRNLRRGKGHLYAFLLLPPVALLALSYLMRPLFVPRAFILSAVAYLVLVAGIIPRAPLPGQGALILATLLLPLVRFLPAQYNYASFPRSPFDAAGAYLEENTDAGELILHDNKLSYFPMVVHSPQLDMTFLPDEPGSHNDTLAEATQEAMGIYPAASVDDALRGESGIWFVTFERALEEYAAVQGRAHPQLERLHSSFELVRRVEFNDLLLFHFRR